MAEKEIPKHVTELQALERFVAQKLSQLPTEELGILLAAGLVKKLKDAKTMNLAGITVLFYRLDSEIRAAAEEVEQLFKFDDAACNAGWMDAYQKMVAPAERSKVIDVLRKQLRTKLAKEIKESGKPAGEKKGAESLFMVGSEIILAVETMYGDEPQMNFLLTCLKARSLLTALKTAQSAKEQSVKIVDVLLEGIRVLAEAPRRKEFRGEEENKWFENRAKEIYNGVAALVAVYQVKRSI